jgi:hypothetical protein
MAGASEFFILSQSGERPEREREILPLRARPRTKIELQRTERCRQLGPWRAGYPPFLRFELLNECSEVRGNGSRQRVILVVQASANLADREEPSISIASGT